MIDKMIREQGEKNIQSFITQIVAQTGHEPTENELNIYRLGLSTGINLAGLGLAYSDIDFNK